MCLEIPGLFVLYKDKNKTSLLPTNNFYCLLTSVKMF